MDQKLLFITTRYYYAVKYNKRQILLYIKYNSFIMEPEIIRILYSYNT